MGYVKLRRKGVKYAMQSYYTAIIFLNMAAMMIIQVCISHSSTLTKRRKRLFHLLFNAIIIGAFCEWMGNFLQGTGESTRLLHIMVKAIELSVAPAIGFFTAWVIEKKNEGPVYIYLILQAVLECLSGKFGFIYSVDVGSNYSHGQFYWIYIAAYMVSILYCVYMFLINVKKYQYNGVGYFLLVVVFMISGIGIQLYNSSLKVDYVTLGMAAAMLYVLTLEMIYQTDELTNLINRRGYENYVGHLEEKCVILFFDVDQFKHINDTYGHAFGDVVLKNVGNAIKEHYAGYGKCFRFGGDEFCVILTKNTEQVKKINQGFKDTMISLRKKENRMPFISIGYTFYDPENQNIRDCVAEADQMMYLDKEKRKSLNLASAQ